MYSVFLSPSFQERNIGADSYGTEEYRMNQIADVVQEILAYNGIKVVRNDPKKDLYGNITLSNASGCDIHLSLHSNAGGGGKAKGTVAFCWPGSNSEKLANLVYARLSKLTPWIDRGVEDGRKLAEIRDTKLTAALFEIDFHDNPESALWIMQNIKDIGISVSLGVCDYFGFSGKLPGQPSPDDEKDAQIADLQKQVQALTAQINEIKANAKAAQQFLKRINPDFIG